MTHQMSNHRSEGSTSQQGLQTDALIPKATHSSQPATVTVIREFWDSCTACGLTASLLYTAALVATKPLSERVSVFQIGFVRSLFCIPVLAVLGYIQTGEVIGKKQHMPLILLFGFLTAWRFLTAVLTIHALPVSESSLVMNSYPAFVAIVEWICGIESIDWQSWLGVAGALIAQLLIARPPFTSNSHVPWTTRRIMGYIYACSNVTIMTATILFVRKSKEIPSIVIANHGLLQTALISLPALVCGFPRDIVWGPSLWDGALYLATCGSALSLVFMVRSVQIGPAVKAAMLSLTRVIMMFLAGVVLFGEEIDGMLAVGCGLMSVSVALVVWKRNSRPRNE